MVSVAASVVLSVVVSVGGSIRKQDRRVQVVKYF